MNDSLVPTAMSVSNEMLIGYKGKSQVDAGFVYAPYIPLSVVGSTHETRGLEHKQCTMSEFEASTHIDIRKELVSSMSKAIQMEIDKEIIEKLRYYDYGVAELRSNAQKYYGTVNFGKV